MLQHGHIACVPAVLAGRECRYFTTHADAEGRVDVGRCCLVGWEWWRDEGGVVALVFMMKFEIGGRHCCDGDTSNDAGWCC